MITQALYDKLHRLATLSRISTEDAREIQSAVQQFINSKYSVCLRCVQQIKHGQQIILNYLSTQEIIENIKPLVETEEPLFEMEEPELNVDVVEAEKVGCSKCNKSRRNKG
jgi:hypothetical protein